VFEQFFFWTGDFCPSEILKSNKGVPGVEYIISDRIFEDLPDEEKKLWHSYAYEVKLGLLISPRVPEMIAMPELENLAKSYGKFWCTWQADREDRVPLGAPALMISPQPQGVKPRLVRPDLVHQRDAKYHVSSDSYKTLVKRVALSNIMVRDLSSHLNTLAESETEGVQGAAATGVFLFPEPEGLYLESERAVSREEGLALAKELGCLLLESSAKTRENVEQCFEELALKLALAAINSEVFLGSAQIYSLQKIKIY
ncbi:hypothetical protein S83_012750, partial [Arachis hypogaea]